MFINRGMWDMLVAHHLYWVMALVVVVSSLPYLFRYILPAVKFIRRMRSPIQRVKATVIMAHQRVIDKQRDSFREIEWYTYDITFEVNPGYKRLEFEVSEDEYARYQPEDTGMLVYQYDKILSFRPIVEGVKKEG